VEEGDSQKIYHSPIAREAYLGNKSLNRIGDVAADLKKLRDEL